MGDGFLESERKRRDSLLDELSIRVARLETDMSWVKQTLRKVDNRVWVILALIIASILIQILARMLS